MATPEEQITPADAAIVTTGTGRKGPEEHDLPESLKYDMDLCLEILRNVLGEYNPNCCLRSTPCVITRWRPAPSISPS